MILVSCNRNDTDEKLLAEEQQLDQYIAANEQDAVRANGIYFKKISETEGVKPDVRDYVLIDYTCKHLYEGTVEQVSYKDYEAYGALYPSPYLEGGPEAMDLTRSLFGSYIAGMREGENARLYVPSRHTNRDFITRLYEITLVKVMGADLTSYQEKLMDAYLKEYYAQATVDTIPVTLDDGKVYHVLCATLQKSREDNRQFDFNIVESNYILNDISDHRPFQEANIQSWPWPSAVKNSDKLKNAETAIMLIPYRLRYGEQICTIPNGQVVVPYEAVLVYLVEKK
ncbi:MAG: hypothetical protein LBR08_04950 [Bacteroidales bacterium]|jgi:hypothetical protein|nr:hypothetical protein [Bacteroidales bacterium]